MDAEIDMQSGISDGMKDPVVFLDKDILIEIIEGELFNFDDGYVIEKRDDVVPSKLDFR